MKGSLGSLEEAGGAAALALVGNRARAGVLPVRAGGPEGTEVEMYSTIHDVDPDLWNALIPEDEVQSTHAFIRACEDARVEDARYWHLLIRRQGELIGVASLSMMPVRLDLLSTGLVRKGIRALRRIRPSLLRPRVLFWGLPVSAGRPCLGIRAPADVPRVLAAIASAMDRAGRECRAQLHCVKEFAPSEAAVMDGLRGHGFFRAHSLPTFRMDVPWRSFDDYLASMRAGYRRQIRATRRREAEQGLRVRHVVDHRERCEAFQALYDQVLDRAEFQLERLNAAFFRNLNDYLGERCTALMVEKDGNLLAAAVLLHSSRQLTFFMTGIDYARNRRHGAYLSLVTEVVAQAIREGVPTLELGQTSSWLKTRLGAIAEDRFIYFRCPSPTAHRLFRRSVDVLFPPTRTLERRVFHDAAD